MRKFMVIPMAGLLVLAAAAPVAAGPNVSNSSGTITIAEATWTSSNNGVESTGYLTATEGGEEGTFVQFETSTGSYVYCAGGPGEEDDFEGFVGTLVHGFGPGDLTIGRNSSSATASATVETATVVIDECNGTWDEQWGGDMTVGLDLVASGSTLRATGRESFHLPNEFNERYSYRAAYRLATGSATIDGATIAADGQIGKVSWSSHSN